MLYEVITTVEPGAAEFLVAVRHHAAVLLDAAGHSERQRLQAISRAERR